MEQMRDGPKNPARNSGGVVLAGRKNYTIWW